jgi:prepilin-type processing-associated H-X9-DG protein
MFSILMVVMAMLLPALRTAHENARKGKCAVTMAQYGTAFRLYQNDHGGKYPEAWVNNSDNWQSYLCGAIGFAPWVGPNAYLPTNWASYMGPPSFAKRINGKFLCPTIVNMFDIPEEGLHDQWGYSLNATRVEISWQTNVGGDWPWFKPEHIGADLDEVYPKSGISAVMTCGNSSSWNQDNDWNATTSSDPTDWQVRPIHNDVVNLLFMDGHVESIDLSVQEGVNDFNTYWFNAIPSTMGNPW